MASLKERFTMHTYDRLPGDSHKCRVVSMISTQTKDGIRIIVADRKNKLLREYDPDTWLCIDSCLLDDEPLSLSAHGNSIKLLCFGNKLHDVHMSPLKVASSVAFPRGTAMYERLSQLDSNLLVVTRRNPAAVDIVTASGLLAHQVGPSTSYKFSNPWSVSCHDNKILVFDRDNGFGKNPRLICLTTERVADDKLTVYRSVFSWRYNLSEDADPGTIAVVDERVFIPCVDDNTLVSVQLDTGTSMTTVAQSRDCPKLYRGSCVVGHTLLVGCDVGAGFVQFNELGKMLFYIHVTANYIGIIQPKINKFNVRFHFLL
jgi:outer membrane protein assembly factor BamB